MLSIHTSPLQQPGRGDAGGLNVYVRGLSQELASWGIDVEIFTADPKTRRTGTTTLAPRVRVHQIDLVDHPETKAAIAGRVDEIAEAIAATPAWQMAELVHAHYWISGAVGLRLIATETHATRRPLIATMHTLALTKNRDVGYGLEPETRLGAEARIVAGADLVIASTEAERRDLESMASAESRARIAVIRPGVDTSSYRPGYRSIARKNLGLDPDATTLLYVGRLQAVKGPDVLIDALGRLQADRPDLTAGLQAHIVGDSSGDSPDDARTAATIRARVGELGLVSQVHFHEPQTAAVLADFYRAADLVVVPSRSESFGLVAAEATASGVPVLAAAVGGLPGVLERSGRLVRGHDPADWAGALADILGTPGALARLADAASHAAPHVPGWDEATNAIVAEYSALRAEGGRRPAGRRPPRAKATV